MLHEEHQDHRDVKCADDVQKMARLRRFEQEFLAYGTVEWREGEPLQYLSTMQADKLFHHRSDRIKIGSYFTPVESLSLRTLVPAGTEEVITLSTKKLLLGRMKKDYQTVSLFDKLEPLFLTDPNDSSFNLLLDLQSSIDGYFDPDQLQIFEGLIDLAYRGKVLSESHYQDFLTWILWTRKQMEDNPVLGDRFKRTFYGFLYQGSHGEIKSIVDAKESTVYQKWEKHLIDQSIVSPILKKTYYFKQFSLIKELRNQFAIWLSENMSNSMDTVFQIKALRGVIKSDDINLIEDEVSSSPEALQVVKYYRALWNTC